MRGLSYAEVMNMSWDEREIIGEIIKENLETTKKSWIAVLLKFLTKRSQ
jgi:hypothetical protein